MLSFILRSKHQYQIPCAVAIALQYAMKYKFSECITKSGPDTGKPCVFPFTHDGETFQRCTRRDSDQLWCSTEVDANGAVVDGKWGYCGDGCNQGKVFCSTLLLAFKLF